jgi:hypothetical protein
MVRQEIISTYTWKGMSRPRPIPRLRPCMAVPLSLSLSLSLSLYAPLSLFLITAHSQALFCYFCLFPPHSISPTISRSLYPPPTLSSTLPPFLSLYLSTPIPSISPLLLYHLLPLSPPIPHTISPLSLS